MTQSEQAHNGAVTSGTPAVTYGYSDGAASGEAKYVRPASLTYPSGRVISYDYGTSGGMGDVLSRVANIKESTTTYASYTHLGTGSVVRIDYPQPQVRLDLWGGTSGTYTGLDRFGRVTDQKWASFAGSDKDRHQYSYDRNSNRSSRDNTLTSNLDELYSYDNLNRLTNRDRGTLSSGSIASPVKEEDWTLESTGNWSGYVTKASGTIDLNQSRSHNKVNEITAISETVGSAWIDPVQDQAGNMTTLPKPSDPTGSYTATYDAWNRLVELKEGTNTVAKYKYDGQGHRIIKETYTSGTLSETRHFYHSNAWQVLEERTGTSTNADRQYIWGVRYVDELVLRDRDADANTGNGLEERLYALQDANFNVTALIDTSGSVVERYSYDAYGKRTILDGSFGVRASSSYDWHHGHQGLMHDPESGLIYNRRRMYHPLLGRFIQRDPIGYVDGMNLYEYVGSNSINKLDPEGLEQFISGRGTFNLDLARNDNYSSAMIITFKPSRKVIDECLCEEISFRQYVREGSITMTSIDTQKEYSIDTGDPYPHHDHVWTRGGKYADAKMNDSPGATNGTGWYYFWFRQDFKTLAICRKGIEKDKSYGTIKWGHNFALHTSPYKVARWIWIEGILQKSGKLDDTKVAISKVRYVPVN